MEASQLAVSEKMTGAVERLSHSALLGRYKEVSGEVKQLFWRLVALVRERVASSETVTLVKDLAKAHLRHLAARISFLNPYLHKEIILLHSFIHSEIIY